MHSQEDLVVDPDQTKRKLDENEDLALRDAFEDAPFEFWIRDAAGRCILQNAAAGRWGDLRGLRIEDSPVPPEVLAAWRANNQRAYAGELVQNEVEYLVDGEKCYYQCVVVPIRASAQVQGILGFNIDVTDRKRAEQALRESERRLREALRVGRMGYLDWDLVTNEIRWSPETYRLFGYTPGKFTPTIEATVGMVLAEDRAFVEERLGAVIRGTADYDIDHRVIRPDGEVIYIHAHGEVMRDEHGKALRMLGTVVDITERRRAEEALRISEERLKQALSAASAGIWELDIRAGKAHWSNENFALYNRDPVRGQPTFEDWQASLHPDDRAAVGAAVRDAIEGKTAEYRAESRVQAPAGERWVLARGQVKRAADGTPLRMVGISIDITARKRAEDELREMDRRRTEFLGVLSHELRNPLAAIRSSLFVLDRAAPGAEQARRALAVIDRQSSHLARLVDDLLDITRINSGKIRLQHARVNLVELVLRTVEDHRTMLASRELAIALPAEAVWVRGDATRLAQVVGNLLTNAAKFSSDGGKVSVSLAKIEARAVLEVADTGLGIDQEMLDNLFVPFVQADRSLDRSRGGLGLGLALVKTLVEMHSGEVSARSEGPGQGAYFTIQLPLDELDPVAIGSPPPVDTRTKRRKVLVIEDNVDAAETLADVLAMSGHEVTVAFDGAAGLAKAREFAPDVVLCDIGLPGAIDGYAVARALQQDAALANAYRIALTGYAQPEDQRKAREAGFEGHFAKPPDLVALIRLLAELPTLRHRG